MTAAVAILLGACGSSGKSHAMASRKSLSAVGAEPPLTQQLVIRPAAYHEVVAKVGSHTITRAYLEGWTPLEVVIASPYKHSSSIPAGFVPDPPAYTRCISYLAAVAPKAGGELKPSAARLKAECEQKHETQMLSTLGHLLSDTISYQEAARHRLSVSEAEIQDEVAKRGLKESVVRALGVPVSYQGYVVGAEMLTDKLFKTLPAYRRVMKVGHETMKMADEVDNESVAFYRRMSKRWRSRTYCAPEFLVPQCSEYGAGAESQL